MPKGFPGTISQKRFCPKCGGHKGFYAKFCKWCLVPGFRTVAEPPIIQGPIALINVGGGRFAIIDAEDAPKLEGKIWSSYFSKQSRSWHARDGSKVFMHEAILGKKPGFWIDHKNSDGLDNRKQNIRHCTPAQNAQNMRKTRGKSLFKGVYYGDKKWKAHITIPSESGSGNRLYLGGFSSEREAALAYDQKAIEHFGEFARLNFPVEQPR
jgi:hypothetical protein